MIINDNEGFLISKNISLAKRLQPDAKRLVLIGDNSSLSKRFYEYFKEYSKNKNMQFLSLSNLSYEEYKNKVKSLSKNDMLFYSLTFKDKNGLKLIPKKAVQELSEIANIPMYIFYSTLATKSVLGGYIIDGKLVGESLINSIIDYMKYNSFGNNYEISKLLVNKQVFDSFGFNSNLLINPVFIYENNNLDFKYKNILFLMFISITLIFLFFLFKNGKIKSDEFTFKKYKIVVYLFFVFSNDFSIIYFFRFNYF